MSDIVVVGLGPAGLDRIHPASLAVLKDEDRTVIVRTLHHPAAAQLAQLRSVVDCDDVYERSAELSDVYGALAEQVLRAAETGPVVYAVPGSPFVGEASVGALQEAASAGRVNLTVLDGESFLPLVLEMTGIDPLDRGFQVLDARNLPDPLLLHLPTLIGQVDTPAVLATVKDGLLRTLPGSIEVVVLDDLGHPDAQVRRISLAELHGAAPGPRLSLFVDPPPAGWPGLVQTNRRLRADCPWDRAQTHQSLAPHIIEEAYELIEAIERLPADAAPGTAAYADVEEELGDLLLQVVFHATLAAEVAGFGIEEVAETVRRKLVRRHPHVFGETEAEDAEAVLANWDRLKAAEKDGSALMDGVPAALPALQRADKVQRRAAAIGFDWPDPEGAIAKISEEADELSAVIGDPGRADDEIGDLLFSAVNVARRLGIDAEMSLRRATDRFAGRFAAMEDGGSLVGLTLEEMDRRWEAVKEAEQ